MKRRTLQTVNQRIQLFVTQDPLDNGRYGY